MQSRGKYKNIGTEKYITVLKLILIYTFYGIPITWPCTHKHMTGSSCEVYMLHILLNISRTVK